MEHFCMDRASVYFHLHCHMRGGHLCRSFADLLAPPPPPPHPAGFER